MSMTGLGGAGGGVEGGSVESPGAMPPTHPANAKRAIAVVFIPSGHLREAPNLVLLSCVVKRTGDLSTTGDGTLDAQAPVRLDECVRAFEDHFDYVHRTLRRLGVPPSDVDDLAQEVFIVMWRRWSEYDQRRGLRAWLSGIAFNIVGSHRRRRARLFPVADLDPADEAPHGEDELAASRARRMVLRVLERLPDRYRTILVLRDIDGMPMRQIAALQGVPLFTAYTWLRKARRHFANALKGERPRHPLLALLGRWWPVALAAAVAVAVISLVAPGHSPEVALATLEWPTKGAAASDNSAARLDCTLRGVDPRAVRTAGRRGSALQLGGQGWLDCPQPAMTPAATDELSVSAWVTMGAFNPANRAVVTRQLGQGSLDHFFLGFTDGFLTVKSDSYGVVMRHYASISAGWHHIAFTLSPQSTALYLDGKPVARRRTGRPRGEHVDTPILIGAGRNRPDEIREIFDGAIADIRVFGRALNDAEMAALAE
jgi:RNA polymerase sigma-70 factor (ECF subfamily)